MVSYLCNFYYSYFLGRTLWYFKKSFNKKNLYFSNNLEFLLIFVFSNKKIEKPLRNSQDYLFVITFIVTFKISLKTFTKWKENGEYNELVKNR